MLEFFRHHRGAFLIFLTVIIIISFSVWGGWTRAPGGGASPTDRAFSIYGRTYTRAETERYQRLFGLAQSTGMFNFAIELLMASRNFESLDGSPLDFSLNLIVLEHLMDEFDIHPSDSEAMEAMRQLQPFQKDGKFDEGLAYNFQEILGMNGMRMSDLLGLLKYEIAFRKLKDLVSKNYSASPLSAEKHYAAMYQTIKASTIAFDLESFKKNVKITDEDIQKTFDDKKENFKTREKRGASWVLFAQPADLDKIEDVAERNKKEAEFTEKVRAFYAETDKPGARLEELAKAHALTVEKAEPFEEASPPEALKEAGDLAARVFDLIPGERSITDPVKTDKGYYFAELGEIIEPKQQELAEVRDQIRDSLTEQRAREAMATAANEAREFLQAGLKEGKKLAELAAEKNLAVTEVPEFDANTPPAAIPNAYQIAQEAEAGAPGTVSKPVSTDSGLLLVVVNAKELRKREDSASMRESVAASIASRERDQIFRAWFGRQKEAANVKLHLRVG